MAASSIWRVILTVSWRRIASFPVATVVGTVGGVVATVMGGSPPAGGAGATKMGGSPPGWIMSAGAMGGSPPGRVTPATAGAGGAGGMTAGRVLVGEIHI